MNKKFLICLVLACASVVLPKKDNTRQKIQLTFVSHQKRMSQDIASQKNFEYCFEILQNFASIQKQRKLTLEEMVTAMHALMFLYLSENDDYSKQIEVLLSGDTKLILPYSQELLIALCSKNEQSDIAGEQA
ncbi:MAG: hypothetical protein NTZ68_00815 [Candidatus Dependentiae bacterium]|nr:hypothetical protein [Candidatus Dependentiae bacterium]